MRHGWACFLIAVLICTWKDRVPVCTVGQAVAACEVVSRALDGPTGPSARTVRLKEMVETVRLISGVSHTM